MPIAGQDFTVFSIYTVNGSFCFTGKHLKERETNNWHYYETEGGGIYHFRKENMVAVFESLENHGAKYREIKDSLKCSRCGAEMKSICANNCRYF